MWNKNNTEFRWEEFQARDTTKKIAHGERTGLPSEKKNQSYSQLDLSLKGQGDLPDHRPTERGKAQKCKSTLRNMVIRGKPKKMRLGNGKSTKDKENVEPPVWLVFPDFVRTRITPENQISISQRRCFFNSTSMFLGPLLCAFSTELMALYLVWYYLGSYILFRSRKQASLIFELLIPSTCTFG